MTSKTNTVAKTKKSQERYDCVCGSNILVKGKTSHEKTKKHTEFINNNHVEKEKQPVKKDPLKKIRKELTTRFEEQIYSNFTTGRTDENYLPWSDERIKEFIKNNRKIITKSVDELIKQAAEDDELDRIEDGWIREYLYDEPSLSILYTFDRNLDVRSEELSENEDEENDDEENDDE